VNLRFPLIAAVLLTAALLMVCGCEAAAFLSQPFAKREPAIYKLPDVSTLIVVDDPGNLLGDPSLPGVIAANLKLELEHNKVFKKGRVIDPSLLVKHMASLGEGGSKVPLDDLGRGLSAQQVIGVHIENADLNQEPGAFRPIILTRVKLISAETGKRIFPPLDAGAAIEPSLAVRGYPVRSQLFYRAGSTASPVDVASAMHTVSQRAGRDAARVFSSYRPREPGTPFEE